MNQNNKKNVLLITADQWRGECLSFLGHPCVQTPSLDALAEDAVAFTSHFAQCAPCGPSRTSLHTGMYLQNHRSVRNGTPLDARHTNVALEARRAGHDPVLFGYTDTTPDPRGRSVESLARGYEDVLPGFAEEAVLGCDHQPWLEDLKAKGYDVSGGFEGIFNPRPGSEAEYDSNGGHVSAAPPIYSAEDSPTGFLTNRFLDYLKTRNGEGWFAHVSYLRPHPPFIAPEPYNTMYDPKDVPKPIHAAVSPEEEAHQHPWLAAALETTGDWLLPWHVDGSVSEISELDVLQTRATYYGLISKVDAYLGRIIQHLKDSGEYDNTLIIFTSDHGEMLGDRWLFGKRGWFDEGYRVPMIVRAPGMTEPGKTVTSFTEAIDIMPTVLEWLGLDIPRQCDGRSLLPFLMGGTPDNWRTEAHWEYDFRDVEDDAVERKLGIGLDQCTMNVIRGERYKYVHFTNLPPLFFDRQADPFELTNLADDPAYAPLVMEYAQKMLSWRMSNDERTLTHILVKPGEVMSR